MVESAPASSFANFRNFQDPEQEGVTGDSHNGGGEIHMDRRPSLRHAATTSEFTAKSGYEKRRSFKDVAKRVVESGHAVHSMKLSPDSVGLTPRRRRRSFLRFTPAMLHWLYQSNELAEDLDTPLVCSFHVALLLIDVSGFTKMSQKLGAELTRKHTSKFFDQIIRCIRHYGGDVLKFLGDALLVAWPTTCPASDEVRQDIALSAATCAAEVMKTLNGYRIQTKEEDLLLTLHGGIAIGNVYAFDVGNADRREFLIGGTVLTEIGDMEAEATSGQLVMSKAFANLLPAKATLEELDSGHVRLNLESLQKLNNRTTMISDYLTWQVDLADDDDDGKLFKDVGKRKLLEQHLEVHVPHSCRKFVHESMLEVLGEMRHVTTLFLALDSLQTHLMSGDVQLVQACFVVIVEATVQTGGVVRQFVLDDKGCVAICAWGLPGAAHGHGQDAVKAIECATQILDTLHDTYTYGDIETGISGSHIGIAAGEVYVGLIGALQRCEYAMVGPSVNLAARLMGKAPAWHVFVEEAVYKGALHVDPTMKFKKHMPVQAKGYDKKVDVYEAVLEQTMSYCMTFHGEFMQKWDSMSPQVQMVGKVASVLSDGPDGHANDFPLRALVRILGELKIATYIEVQNAMMYLKSARILRLTRGARRGNPSFAFADDKFRGMLLSLLTAEYTAKLHGMFVRWLEERIEEVKRETVVDSAAHKAKLVLLHHEVDPKIQHHMHRSTVSPVSAREWFFRLFDGCCATRKTEEPVSLN